MLAVNLALESEWESIFFHPDTSTNKGSHSSHLGACMCVCECVRVCLCTRGTLTVKVFIKEQRVPAA